MKKEKTKKKLLDWMMSEEYSKLKEEAQHRESRMKPLEGWTCQRAENLKKKSSKIPINNYAATMVSAARRQIIGGGAPINKSRRRRPQIGGGGGGGAGAQLYSQALYRINFKLYIVLMAIIRLGYYYYFYTF